jgi:hypothetical protein
VASILQLSRKEASLLANSFGVGFIDWLGLMPDHKVLFSPRSPCSEKT